VSTHYVIEKRVIDLAYTLIGFYGLIVIGILVFDHYGTFWPKEELLDNNLLVYLFVIDVIVITSNICSNLIDGCDINQLLSTSKNLVTEFLLFLNYIKTHLDLLYEGEEDKTNDHEK
jgi:hypothetical protein